MLAQLHLLERSTQRHGCHPAAPWGSACGGAAPRAVSRTLCSCPGHMRPTFPVGIQHRAAVTASESSPLCGAASAEIASTSSSSSSSGLGSPPPGPGGSREPDEYYTNFGEAVKVLREDLPQIFQRDLQWHIYREDVTFRTPSLQYFTGLWKYQLLNRSARYLITLLYRDVTISTLRMWQPEGNPRQLRVRWSMVAHPRLRLLSADPEPTRTEAISTYTFDSKGLIYEHQVDRIIPPESLLGRLVTWVTARLQQERVVLPVPGEVPLPAPRGLHQLDQ